MPGRPSFHVNYSILCSWVFLNVKQNTPSLSHVRCFPIQQSFDFIHCSKIPFSIFVILQYVSKMRLLLSLSSSSTIRLRPPGMFFPPGNRLPISFVVFLYFSFLQVCDLFFLGNLLSSILCICSVQFILYCVNFSLISKIPNSYLMQLFLFLPKVYILPMVLKNSFQRLQFSSCLIDLGTSSQIRTV